MSVITETSSSSTSMNLRSNWTVQPPLGRFASVDSKGPLAACWFEFVCAKLVQLDVFALAGDTNGEGVNVVPSVALVVLLHEVLIFLTCPCCGDICDVGGRAVRGKSEIHTYNSAIIYVDIDFKFTGTLHFICVFYLFCSTLIGILILLRGFTTYNHKGYVNISWVNISITKRT